MRLFLVLFAVLFSCIQPCFAQGHPERALFVSVIQDPQVMSSRNSIDELVAYAEQAGIGILFVQVYRANMAWFPSTMADQSPYDKALQKVGEDPFQLLIRSAHAKGIAVHAWVNLLSLSKNTNAPLLKKYGPEILTRNKLKKKALDDYMIDQQYFLEPGDLRVRDELAVMVTELAKRYMDLDGIQFDYIRYPDQSPHYGYTRMNMDRFRNSSGAGDIEESSLQWNNWKRDQVTALVIRLSRTARSIHPGIKVSTTGCAPYIRAFDEAFQDWPTWVNTGLVDFVTEMTYSLDTPGLKKFIDESIRLVRDPQKLYLAIGAYQQAQNPARFAEQLKLCADAGVGGCATFHYGSLVESPALKEVLVNSFQVQR